MGWIEAQFRTLKKPNAGSRDGQGDHHHLGNLNRTNIDRQPLGIDCYFGELHDEAALGGRTGKAHLVACYELKIDVAGMVDALLAFPAPDREGVLLDLPRPRRLVLPGADTNLVLRPRLQFPDSKLCRRFSPT